MDEDDTPMPVNFISLDEVDEGSTDGNAQRPSIATTTKAKRLIINFILDCNFSSPLNLKFNNL